MSQWPKSIVTEIYVDAQERGLAQDWLRRVKSEVHEFDPANARSPKQMYKDSAKAFRRWLDDELAARERAHMEIPRVLRFELDYFSGLDGHGRRIASVDVLTGRIRTFS